MVNLKEPLLSIETHQRVTKSAAQAPGFRHGVSGSRFSIRC